MLAVRNAKVYTISRGTYPAATVLIKDGKFVSVSEQVDLPADCQVIDAAGLTMMPGIVEAHCHLIAHDWGFEGDEEGEQLGTARLAPAVTPDIDYWYHFDPRHQHLNDALAGGVTTCNIIPGSGRVINGTGFVTKTYGTDRKRMVLSRNSGVKVALGENPKRAFGGRQMMPMTRMGSAALLREALVKTQDYIRRKEKALAKGEHFALNLQLEPLVPLLKGETIAKIHAHRSDDIMTAIRIADEFGFGITLEHATEGHFVVEEIAKRNIPCIVGPTFGSRGKVETSRKTFTTPGILERAGILVAITTDASVLAIELLRTCASFAWKEGMSEEGALKAITLNAAKICGVDERIGSIEPGKDADFLLLDGHPLSLRSRVQKVYVNGELALDRETYKEPWQRR